MYHEHFGLERAPFRITPDTELFYAGGGRGEVLEALVYAVTSGEGIVKVTGEVGTGKTMLCRMLEVRLPPTVEVVYIANPSLSPEDILHAIALEMNLPVEPTAGRLQVMHALQQRLLEKHAENRRVVVFVEEAQSMPTATLEEIRLLSNLETQRDKLLQIVLFGQPELDETLARPNIRQLRERITHSFRLEPLGRDEVREYVRYRMRAVGYRGPDVFKEAAYRNLARASEGLVRRINILADKALLAAFADDTHNVSARHMRVAIEDGSFTPVANRRVWWLATAALVLALMFGALFVLDQPFVQDWLRRYQAELAPVTAPAPVAESPAPSSTVTPVVAATAASPAPAAEPAAAPASGAVVAAPTPAPPAPEASVSATPATAETAETPANTGSAPAPSPQTVVAAAEPATPVTTPPPAPARSASVEPTTGDVEVVAPATVQAVATAPPAATMTTPAPPAAPEVAATPAPEAAPAAPAAVSTATATPGPALAVAADPVPRDAGAGATAAGASVTGTAPGPSAGTGGATTATAGTTATAPAAVEPAAAVTPVAGGSTSAAPPPLPADSSVQVANRLLAERVRVTNGWLRDAKSGHFSIQLLLADVSRQDSLEAFLQRMERLGSLDQVYVYETTIGSRSWFGVLYRDYASYDEARQALESLPEDLKRHKPFIRNVRDIVGQG